MEFSKVFRAVAAGAMGIGLGIGAACVVQEAPRAPQQPQPVTATAPGAQQAAPGQLADGWYYCQFRDSSTAYKRYYCRVYRSGGVQRIHKAGGFETFTGTLVPAGSGIRLDGQSGCNRMGTNCRGKFQVALAAQGRAFRGQVQGPGWWLHNGALSLEFISTQAPHDAFGGAGYAGAGYGGAHYGGGHYGGVRYGGAHYGGVPYGHRR